MSIPSLALGISAPGVSEVERMARALNSVDAALARIGGPGATNLGGLAAVTSELSKIRAAVGVEMAGLRTDLAGLGNTISKSLQESFKGMAQAANTGGKQVAKEVKEAAAETEKAVSIYRTAARQMSAAMKEAGSYTQYSPIPRGSAVKAQFQAERTTMEQAVAAFRATQATRLADQLAFEQKQKAMFQAYDAERRARMAVEATSMDAAVAKYKANQERRLASQLTAEAAQRAAFEAHKAKQQAQYVGEAMMMESAVAKYRAIQDQKLAAQLSAEAKQRALFEAHKEAQRARLATESTMMDAAVAKYRANKAEELASQMAAEAKQKELWVSHTAALRAKLAAEARMMDLAVAQYRKFNAERTAGIASSVAQATARASGPWTSLVSGNVYGMPKEIENTGNAAAKAAPKIKGFTHEMRDAHSAARGLASGFSAMWLTWGNLLPLLAGAALSHGFVQTIKMGAEVQNTFTQIRVLAGATAQEIVYLNNQMMELSRSSQYGPREVASAMKTLSLAGLDAAAVYSSVRDVLNFAVSGDTSIEKAADVMTSVATAFNISADRYSYVGDAISKAAAESKSSVEGMGEAFKTASVIHQQYGVTLEDTAVGLALLANAGINNTAAGTAMRNMYADLAGRTPKVEKAMKELGVNAIDPMTGKLRDLTSIFEDLSGALANYTPSQQFKFIQDIFSERGGKEAIAVMNAMQQKAKDMGTSVGSAFDELREKVLDSAGFTTLAAAEMSLTPLNQMKSVVASLQATLVETFDELQPYILDISTKLKELFAGEEFRTNLRDLMKLMAESVVFLIEHGRAITTVIATYVALKAASGVLSNVVGGLIALRTAVVGFTAATTLSTAAVAGLGVASATFTPILAILAGVVTAAAAGWAAYKFWMGQSADTTEKFVGSNYATELLKRLEEEEQRLDRVNEARSRGISLMQLEAELDVEKARGSESVEMAAARNDIASLARAGALRAMDVKQGSQPSIAQLKEAAEGNKLLLAARQRLADAEKVHGETLIKTEMVLERIKTKRAEEAAAIRNEQRLAALTSPRGLGVRAEPFDKAGAAEAGAAHNAAMGHLRTVEDTYRKETRLLDDKLRSQEMSQGAYYANLIQSTADTQAKISKIANLTQDDITKAKNTIAEKMSDAVADYTSETNRLVKANDQYWSKADQAMARELSASQTKRDLANATEEVRAVAEAHTKVESSHIVVLDNLKEKLGEAERSVKDFYEAYGDRELDTDAASFATSLHTRVAALTKELKEANDQIAKLKGLAGQDALNDIEIKKADAARREIAGMAKDINNQLTDAIMDGGKDGFRSLRDWATDLFKQPFRMVIQAIIQPIGNAFANMAGNMMGVGGTGGAGVPGIGSLGGLLGSGYTMGTGGSIASIGTSLFGAGGMAGSLAAGAGWMTGATTFTGALGAAGSLMGTGTAAGMMSGAGMALGALGPIGMGIGLLMALSGGKDSRMGGGYSLDSSGVINKFGGPRKGNNGEIQPGEVRSALTTTMSDINSAIKSLGGSDSVSQLVGALESSKKGRGFVFANATLSSGAQVGDLYETSNNRRGSYTEEEAMAAYGEELKQVTLQALQASDIKGKLADYIRGLGDIDNLLGEALTTAYDHVQKVLTEKLALDQRLIDLTTSALEKLNVQRQAEIDAVDESNLELLKQVHAQEDVNTAAAALVEAFNRETGALEDYAKTLRAWLQEVMVGANSPLSVFEKLAQSEGQFNQTLALAQSGDATARGDLTNKADAYLANLLATSGSRIDYATKFSKVTSAVAGQASSAETEYTLAQESLNTQKAQLEALGLINSSVLTLAQAWANFNNANAALSAAKVATTASQAVESTVAAPDTTWEGKFASGYKNLFGYEPTADTLAYVAEAYKPNGWDPKNTAKSLWDNPYGIGYGDMGFADGGYHWGGMRLVGERGPELEVTGASYIHDAAATRRILSGNGDNSEAASAELVELRMLRTAVEANVGFTYKLSKDFRELKERGFPVTNSPEGDPLEVTTV